MESLEVLLGTLHSAGRFKKPAGRHRGAFHEQSGQSPEAPTTRFSSCAIRRPAKQRAMRKCDRTASEQHTFVQLLLNRWLTMNEVMLINIKVWIIEIRHGGKTHTLCCPFIYCHWKRLVRKEKHQFTTLTFLTTQRHVLNEGKTRRNIGRIFQLSLVDAVRVGVVSSVALRKLSIDQKTIPDLRDGINPFAEPTLTMDGIELPRAAGSDARPADSRKFRFQRIAPKNCCRPSDTKRRVSQSQQSHY